MTSSVVWRPRRGDGSARKKPSFSEAALSACRRQVSCSLSISSVIAERRACRLGRQVFGELLPRTAMANRTEINEFFN